MEMRRRYTDTPSRTPSLRNKVDNLQGINELFVIWTSQQIALMFAVEAYKETTNY